MRKVLVILISSCGANVFPECAKWSGLDEVIKNQDDPNFRVELKTGGQSVIKIVNRLFVLKKFKRDRSFLRELRVLESLREWDLLHPQNPQLVLYPKCVDNATLTLVFPYASGGDLGNLVVDSWSAFNKNIKYQGSTFSNGSLKFDIMNSHNFQSTSLLISQMTQLMLAVDRLHHAGYLHMDIKPENIVLEGDNLFLIDMGLASPIDRESNDWTQRQLRMVGTKQTMSPEVLLPSMWGIPVTPASDWWSVGVVLYYMTTGGSYPYYLHASFESFGEKIDLQWYLERQFLNENLIHRCDLMKEDRIIWRNLILRDPMMREILFGPEGLLSWNPANRVAGANKFLRAI